MNMDVETTTLEAAATATQILQARILEAEQTREVMRLSGCAFSKRDKALKVIREALDDKAREIEAVLAALPEGDWRAPLLGARHALIDAVDNGLAILDS